MLWLQRIAMHCIGSNIPDAIAWLSNQHNLTQINSIPTQAKPVPPNRNKPNPCLPNAIQSNPHQDNTNHPNPTPHDPTQSNAFCSWPRSEPLEISLSPLSLYALGIWGGNLMVAVMFLVTVFSHLLSHLSLCSHRLRSGSVGYYTLGIS